MLPITFATFDIEIDQAIEQRVRTLEPNFIRYDSKELISTLFASTKKVHPCSEAAVLTDLSTQFAFSSPEIKIFRFPVSTEGLMLSRAMAQLEFLKQELEKQKPSSHVVFLDSDMLVQKSLEPIFDQSFDIALTYREHLMPINGGLIIVNGNSLDVGCDFMQTYAKTIEEGIKEFHSWYGCQLALRELVEIPPLENHQQTIIKCHGARVLLLPCFFYNYTPATRIMNAFYPDKTILHFKGTRKKFQAEYYNKYLLRE